MKEFKEYLKVILEHEGGYVDHPSDPGGATKYGISLMFLKGLPLPIADIDHDGDIDGEDIKKLTVEKAGELYKIYFWDKMNLVLIEDELLKLHLFDMGVNAGNKTAIKLLQKLLIIPADGIIGNQTIKAIESYGEGLTEDYAKARKEYYYSLTIKNPKLKVFLKGWLARVASCHF